MTDASTIYPPPAAGLVARLRFCAGLWAQAGGLPLSRLGALVLNDTGFFARVDGPEASTTTRTLERFARWLSDGANWPEGEVPDEVCAFAHIVGVCSEDCTPSPDNSPENIGVPAAALSPSGRTPAPAAGIDSPGGGVTGTPAASGPTPPGAAGDDFPSFDPSPGSGLRMSGVLRDER